MDRLHVSNFRAVADGEFQFQSEIDVTPSAEQLEEILAGYDANDDWEDVGFEFSGYGGHQEWLSHTYGKVEVPVRVTKKNEVITGHSLGASLMESRSTLIKELGKSDHRTGG